MYLFKLCCCDGFDGFPTAAPGGYRQRENAEKGYRLIENDIPYSDWCSIFIIAGHIRKTSCCKKIKLII